MQVDQDNSGEIDFEEFCNVILKHKAATAKNQDEADTLDAFVALGGNVSDCPYLNQSAETSHRHQSAEIAGRCACNAEQCQDNYRYMQLK
jgi:hypothetical protein